jgi:hypothetical protein
MPSFIDYPVDGVITQYFGGQHGGVDLVDRLGEGAPVYAPCDGQLVLHPQGSWGDGSFGNAAKIATADGLYVLMAHFSGYAGDVYDGMTVQAGKRLGYQGHTGYTIPAGPGGSHVHWGVCRVPWFPTYPSAPGEFVNPLDYLIPESERMALFTRLEKVMSALGGEPAVEVWNATGNSLLAGYGLEQAEQDTIDARLALIEGRLGALEAGSAQAYALNNVLQSWRVALQAQLPGLVLP